MQKKFILLFLTLYIGRSYVLSQVQKDAVLWAGISLEKKINKRLSLKFLNQTTFNQNYREVGNIFFDLGMSYRFHKNFEISGNYRFAESRNLNNYYNEIQRFYSDLTYSKGYNKFYFQFRTRIQTQLYGLNIFDSYKNNKNMSRNKISLRYNINRVYSPYIFVEHFFRLNNVNQAQAIRIGAGLTYKFNLKHRLDFYYLNQFQLNNKNARTDFISGITYSFKF